MIGQEAWFGLACSGGDVNFIDEVRTIMRAQRSCMYTLNDIFATAILPGSELNKFVLLYRDKLWAEYRSKRFNLYQRDAVFGGVSMKDVATSLQYINAVLPPDTAAAVIGTSLSVPPRQPFSNVFSNVFLDYAETMLTMFADLGLDLPADTGDGMMTMGITARMFCARFYERAFSDQSNAVVQLLAHFTVVVIAPQVQVYENMISLLEGREWHDNTVQSVYAKRLRDRNAAKVVQQCRLDDPLVNKAVYTFAAHRDDLIAALHQPVLLYLSQKARSSCEEGLKTTTDGGVNLGYAVDEVEMAMKDFKANTPTADADQRMLSVLMHSDTDVFDHYKCTVRAFVVAESVVASNSKIDMILHIICGSDAIKLLMAPLVASWRSWGVRYAFLLAVGGHDNPLRQKLYSRLGFVALFADEEHTWKQVLDVVRLHDIEADANAGIVRNVINYFRSALLGPPAQPEPAPSWLSFSDAASSTLDYARKSRAFVKALREIQDASSAPDLLPMVADMTVPNPSVSCLVAYMTQRDVNCDGRGGGTFSLHDTQRRGSSVDRVYKQRETPMYETAKRVFDDQEVQEAIASADKSPKRRRRI
ncbi:hypothetical protein JKP88DRAFT_244976 [Tribonema minus]|uniref:Uncharacterized protein n=1 Tax=Tribonema minus TaxID=303371 RepID=A0A835YZ82_9STRA|nr:hypothetical protein JKP88DRAFT_244976 [Tribonema minus]